MKMAEGQQFPNVVELNVGGTHITTSLSTLTKYSDSMLATMFSGRQPLSTDSQGRYFVDCDGDIFKLILEYLRFGSLPPESFALKVYEYARYFCLQELTDALKPYTEVKHTKEMLRISGRLTLYDKMKCNIVSNVLNKDFSPITFNFSRQASLEQQQCGHDFDSVVSFWYLSKNIPTLDWIKAMQYELDKEGIQCQITNKKTGRCFYCQMSFNYLIHVSFNDCKN